MRSSELPASPRSETFPGSVAHSSSYKWWVVLMLWFVCFFNYADRQTIAAVSSELEREFGFNKEQLGLIGSAFMWVYAGGALFAGLVVDRFRRKTLILGGCLFWSFVTVATAWCSQLGAWPAMRHLGGWVGRVACQGPLLEATLGVFGALLLVRALEGLGETFYFPASMALVSDYHDRRTRSRALSFHQSSVYAGTILGSWIGALLAMRAGWRSGFYLFGTAGILLAIALWKCLREPVRGQAESAGLAAPGAPADRPLGILETFRVIFRSPAVILLMLAFVCANAVATVFLFWTPNFLKEKFHYDLATAGLSGTVFINTASFLAVPAAGLLADKWSRRHAGGRALVQALGLLGGAAFVFLVGNTQSRITLIVAMVIFGLCKGFYDSGIFAALYDSVEPRARGTAAGIMNTVGWGGGAFGPWLVGRIAEHGSKPTKIENMSDAIAWGGALYVIGAALLVGAVLLMQRSNPPPAHAA